MKAYLIIDIGTGNVRVALVETTGGLLWVGRDDVHYREDGKTEDALYFEPDLLWGQIVTLIKAALLENRGVDIVAITSSSQREGVVLVDHSGASVVGFPNHDHRGRALEDLIEDKDMVYKLTGRYPTSLFSALKVVAYREKYPEEWRQVDCFMSISDWAQYRLCGVKGYEHAQASETLLYDVENKRWSDQLLSVFKIEQSKVPPLLFSGTRLGTLKKEVAGQLGLDPNIPVFVGGADTQLAVKSTRPDTGDVVIVSGTTTPLVKIGDHYELDDQQRSWTNSHLNKEQYILETNCGVTGLNYQRIKSIFYPNDSYETMEAEMDKIKEPASFACLGSLLADDRQVVTRGGFLFNVPVMTELSRADFAFAALWDIACSIKANFDCLVDISGYDRDYLWCCGGGFQSRLLRTFVSGLIQKKLLFRSGYQQASVSGAAVVCSERLGNYEELDDTVEVVRPKVSEHYRFWYEKWRETREALKRPLNVK